MIRIFTLLSCLLISFVARAGEEVIIYPEAKSNVSYQQVTGLAYTPANARLVYASDNPELQSGMLWLPDALEPGDKAPLVVLIHGGCWLNAYDIQHTWPLSTALAQAGYAVWSLEYRRTGDAGGGWPGSYNDIRAGLAYLPELRDYPIDLDQVVVVGHSAGGHLALLAGAETDGLQGVIGLAAITDIIDYSKGANSCQTAAPKFMGGSYMERQKAYAAANPAGKQMRTTTVLLHGDMDAIVPLSQSTLMEATVHVQEGAGHFDWVHPGTAAFQLLLATLDELVKP